MAMIFEGIIATNSMISSWDELVQAWKFSGILNPSKQISGSEFGEEIGWTLELTRK